MINTSLYYRAKPGNSEELKRLYLQIQNLLKAHPQKALTIQTLANEVKTCIETEAPLIQEMTDEICPSCKNSYCTNINGRFDWCDLIYFAGIMVELPPFRDGLKENDPCQFLAEKGCILPRTMRPHRCNWWYCEPLLAYMNRWPAVKLRNFISVLEKKNQTRTRMYDELASVLV